MKLTRKILCVLLAVLMLVPVFASCKKDGADTQDSSVAVTDPAGETPEAPKARVSLEGYKFIYAVEASSAVTQAVREAITKIKEKTGVELTRGTDLNLSSIDQDRVENDEKEILVGNTNRVQSKKIKFDNAYTYTVKHLGNKVIVCGSTDEATVRAINGFVELVCADGTLSIEENYDNTVDYIDEIFSDGTAMNSLVAGNYKVVYPHNTKMNENGHAQTLSSELGFIAGTEIAMIPDSQTWNGKEILVGMTSRTNTEADDGLTFYDYRITVTDKGISLTAGSSVSLGWAANYLIDGIKNNSIKLDEIGTTDVDFKYDSNPIVDDISTFKPNWSGKVSVPSWMLDFEEKTYAIMTPQTEDYRVTIRAHRGDGYNYPENSIEGLASAILLGADAVELDVHLTKDGVAVLMHDDTLTRTTNVGKLAGKNGLPQSSNVSDWTFEQLQLLSLVHNGVDTGYKIPSLYLALKLCSGKIFVQVDDKSSTVRLNDDLYRMALETDSRECMLYYEGLALLRRWADKTPKDAEFAAFVKKCQYYQSLSGHGIRDAYWPVREGMSNAYNGGDLDENIARWNKMVDAGKMMIWCDKAYPALTQYVIDNFQANEVPVVPN